MRGAPQSRLAGAAEFGYHARNTKMPREEFSCRTNS